MFDLAEVLFDFLMAGVTVWLVLKTLDTFFQRRKGSVGHILLWALYFLFLIIIPIGSIYISAHEFFAVRYEISVVSSMGTFSFLLIFNIVIFEIYAKNMKDFLREKEMMVYAQQVDIMAKNTQERIMEEYYEEKHNLVNELVVLKDMVENREWESAIYNLNKIMKICVVNEKVAHSGNSAIDAIINFKYAIAKEKNIEFVLKLFVPENMIINQCDLGIILGNALDNAIEAVSACVNSKRVIEVSMGIKKEALVIVIKNPYEHELRQDKEENFITTKNESIGHGYGIHSIKKVVDSYHGETIIDVDDNIFKMIIILSLMEEDVA